MKIDKKTKVYTHCGKEKPVEDFGMHRRTRDGLQPWCKECQKKNYYRNKRIEHKIREQLEAEYEQKLKDIMEEYSIFSDEDADEPICCSDCKFFGSYAVDDDGNDVMPYCTLHNSTHVYAKGSCSWGKRKTELLPGPFCGGEANVFVRDWDDGTESFHIECQSCGAEAGHDVVEQKAIEAWNTRKYNVG